MATILDYVENLDLHAGGPGSGRHKGFGFSSYKKQTHINGWKVNDKTPPGPEHYYGNAHSDQDLMDATDKVSFDRKQPMEIRLAFHNSKVHHGMGLKKDNARQMIRSQNELSETPEPLPPAKKKK